MNEALTIALLQADLEGDQDAVKKIIAMAKDPKALAAVQVEPTKGGKDAADSGLPSSSFRG